MTSRLLALLFFIISLPACSVLSNKLPYRIEVSNYGSNGVILRHFPVPSVANHPSQWYITPGGPDERDPRVYHFFIGHKNALPTALAIHWQLAKLSNCDEYPCDWTPIKGKRFSKTLNLAALAQRAKRYSKVPGIAAPNCLLIKFFFREDQLTAKAVKAHFGGVDPPECYGSVPVSPRRD